MLMYFFLHVNIFDKNNFKGLDGHCHIKTAYVRKEKRC